MGSVTTTQTAASSVKTEAPATAPVAPIVSLLCIPIIGYSHPVQGVSNVPATLPVTANPAPSASAPSVTTPPATQTAAPQVTIPSASSTSTSTVLAGAAGQASAEEEPFTLPGQKLSVVPIGLGVLGGISAIALIVVGLVTYERTKYRKVCLLCSSAGLELLVI